MQTSATSFAISSLVTVRQDATVTEIGRLIRNLRRSRGLTQTQLSEITGLAQNYISLLERGGIDRPSEERLQILASGLDVDVAVLKKAIGYVVDPEQHARMNAAEFVRFLASNPKIDVVGLGMTELKPEERRAAIMAIWEAMSPVERNRLLRDLLEEE